jgi:hypothetical protein
LSAHFSTGKSAQLSAVTDKCHSPARACTDQLGLERSQFLAYTFGGKPTRVAVHAAQRRPIRAHRPGDYL